ncbi:MAG: four helix bundle protein, partial [Parcubacteria group bacterium]|nr:four helix bundle protein [Parcubacteria group bacterium]
MTNQIPNSNDKKYDLLERSSKFGTEIIKFVRLLPDSISNRVLILQLVRSATSVGANYVEADEAGSKKEFQYRINLCRKEAKESMYWLRMVAEANPSYKDQCRALWKEAHEFVLIFSSIVRRKYRIVRIWGLVIDWSLGIGHWLFNYMLTLGFWSALPRPFFALAPMANVTDSAFRQMFVRYGKPDVLWTEFVSVDGLCSKEGRAALAPDLYFTPSERPIVLQIFGAKPDNFYKVGILARELGFDGVDINMGCPDDAVCRQGAGIALIKTPDLAQKIIRETKRGAGDLPVSVKTRIGYNKIEYEPWILSLLSAEPA